ncbi:MAG: MATE family efflux transporter [Puniceicoccales bacterium]|jgi:MATE family multidrug resistance protein|nr:MATE family efflux transporter [Puniceicoccales bacterium]
MSDVKLTKYTPGGIGELCALSWPIMLSAAAGYMMLVIDRIILSRYSTEAFNSCFGAIQSYWMFAGTVLEFSLIAEVFVGQYNGARRYREIGPVIWQMIWFCLSLFVLFIPLAIWVIPHLVASNIARLGVPYLRIISLFVPIHVIGYGVLSAFFVGRGQTKIISVLTILSGCLNAFLDFIFVFGCRVTEEGYIGIVPGYDLSFLGRFPWAAGWEIVGEHGVIGAAAATVIAETAFTAVLLILFLKKSNRSRYATDRLKFDENLLKKCLSKGSPQALNRFINSFFWATTTQIIAQHVTADEFQGYGISHSIYMIFFFIIEGMAAGTRTVCSNALGARTFEIIPRNMRSWVTLSAACIFLVSLGMLIYPDALIGAFIRKAGSGEVYKFAKEMLIWAWLTFSLDFGANNLLSTLLAAGDTKFTMYVNTCVFFCCVVLPVQLGIIYFGYGSVIVWQFLLLDLMIRMIFFIYRYRTGRWRLGQLI